MTAQQIYGIYEAISCGEVGLLTESFDEEVDFRSNAPIEVFPYLGHRRGREEVLKALWAARSEFRPLSILPIWVVLQEDAASVLLSVQATQRSTGRTLRYSAAHFLRFRDRRIVELREILDSFEAAQQVVGREFDLSGRQRPTPIKCSR
jgi:ketosteroid isomerase-like protein